MASSSPLYPYLIPLLQGMLYKIRAYFPLLYLDLLLLLKNLVFNSVLLVNYSISFTQTLKFILKNKVSSLFIFPYLILIL